jgi:hypothetical protein
MSQSTRKDVDATLELKYRPLLNPYAPLANVASWLDNPGEILQPVLGAATGAVGLRE